MWIICEDSEITKNDNRRERGEKSSVNGGHDQEDSK